MIIFTARLKALTGKEEEAAQQLARMVDEVQKNESQALAYICHKVTGKPGEFLFYEVYANEEAKAAHMNTPHFEVLKSLFGVYLDNEYGVVIEDLEQIKGFYRNI